MTLIGLETPALPGLRVWSSHFTCPIGCIVRVGQKAIYVVPMTDGTQASLLATVKPSLALLGESVSYLAHLERFERLFTALEPIRSDQAVWPSSTHQLHTALLWYSSIE